MGSLGGVCFDCEFPCTECGTAPQICTQCSQADGISFNWGPNCINECPIGYLTNETKMKCEGCGIGCEQCDSTDIRICE